MLILPSSSSRTRTIHNEISLSKRIALAFIQCFIFGFEVRSQFTGFKLSLENSCNSRQTFEEVFIGIKARTDTTTVCEQLIVTDKSCVNWCVICYSYEDTCCTFAALPECLPLSVLIGRLVYFNILISVILTANSDSVPVFWITHDLVSVVF